MYCTRFNGVVQKVHKLGCLFEIVFKVSFKLQCYHCLVHSIYNYCTSTFHISQGKQRRKSYRNIKNQVYYSTRNSWPKGILGDHHKELLLRSQSHANSSVYKKQKKKMENMEIKFSTRRALRLRRKALFIKVHVTEADFIGRPDCVKSNNITSLLQPHKN